MSEKRRDNRGCVLLNGEYQQKNGRYRFKYYDNTGKSKFNDIYKEEAYALLNVIIEMFN